MTEKMKFETKDLIQENIAKIGQLFPEVLTEAKDDNGILKKAIDFDKLRQILSTSAISNRETYDFTWVGKKQAILEAATPIRKTLRPCKEESVNWDTTQNLYIEGDNLDVLKLLQDCYVNQVKMIYIDPPYNTGKDFIYKDDFAVSQKEYNESDGRVDECGNRLVKNTDSNGRFHSDWCSMMYPRLKLARNLLADDGVIFISIDENEYINLGKLCDEVFGENNFVECFTYEKKSAAKGVPPVNMVVGVHEYILAYAKCESKFRFLGIMRDKATFSNPDNDPRGLWRNTNIKSTTSEKKFSITNPETGDVFTDTWAFSQSELENLIKDKRIIFPKKTTGQVRMKEFFNEFPNLCTPIKSSLGLYDAQWNTEMLCKLMGGKYFPNPKHLKLMYDIINATLNKDSIILDFFSGSATTAHAVMKLNAEDGGNRKFIMVQLPEPCDEKSEAYKAGYKNICEIGKERIRRAAKQIKGENPEANFDGGFRVFKLAESNMKEVYFSPSEYKQDLLSQMTSNIKEDRTDMDLLYGCMLEWKLPLSFPHTSEKVGSYTIHNVNNGALMACFDENIPEDIIRHMAAKKPRGVVFRDAGFADSPAKINIGELFKLLSPDTKVKVI